MTDAPVVRPVHFTIVEIGARAAGYLTPGARFQVAAVFERSFYICDANGRYVCIGGNSIGRGPLNAIVHPEPIVPWGELAVEAGLDLHSDGTLLGWEAGPTFDFGNARIWTSPPWPPAAPVRANAVEHLIALARGRAIHDGLLPVVLATQAIAPPIARALQSRAQLSIATLSDWLDDVEAGDPVLDAAAENATHRLLGLGSGLTPSGDDLLAGLLIALHALGRNEAASRIGAFISRAPADATSTLSRAFLDCAIAGEPTEPIHLVLSATLTANLSALPSAVDGLADVGHTSGWDMLAGVIMALQASLHEP